MTGSRVAASFISTGSGSHRWGIILAGGDGKRLLPLTRSLSGDDRPKQFSTLMGNETLLRQTQRRILPLVKRWQTLLVLTKTHEPFYANQVNDVPSSSLVVQPQNQGTAAAVLYSLMRAREMDPKGLVGFFPSDHYFADEAAFHTHIEWAYAAASCRPDLVFLLGITPDSPETGYGWIEAGAPLAAPFGDSVRTISRFWEKPTQALASSLLARGCLWNSFVMIGHVQAFLNMIRGALPALFQSFQTIRSALFSRGETAAVGRLYSRLEAANFSHDVLSVATNQLAVLCGAGLGWSDLGEPERVLSIATSLQTVWKTPAARPPTREESAVPTAAAFR